jgi:hypothetical protein
MGKPFAINSEAREIVALLLAKPGINMAGILFCCGSGMVFASFYVALWMQGI